MPTPSAKGLTDVNPALIRDREAGVDEVAIRAKAGAAEGVDPGFEWTGRFRDVA